MGPSHDLKTTIHQNKNEHGQFTAKTELCNGTIEIMNRDLIILIEAKINDSEEIKPAVMIEKTDLSTAALVSLIPRSQSFTSLMADLYQLHIKRVSSFRRVNLPKP